MTMNGIKVGSSVHTKPTYIDITVYGTNNVDGLLLES